MSKSAIQDIFDQVEALRLKHGISRMELCRRAGVSRKAFYYSKAEMKLSTLQRLLEALQATLTVEVEPDEPAV